MEALAHFKLDHVGIVDRAEISIPNGLLLIVGDNRQGKSTTFRALRACLLDTGAVISGVFKDDGPIMCAGGSKAGFAQLSNAEATHTIQWPSCKVVKPKGRRDTLPKASWWAAGGIPTKTGIHSIFDIKTEERLAAFAGMFDADPVLEDLQNALVEAGVADLEPEGENKHVESDHVPYSDIWDQIRQIEDIADWPKAHAFYQNEAKEQKGAWREVTGAPAWGRDVGATWEAEVERPAAAPTPNSTSTTTPAVDLEELRFQLTEAEAEEERIQAEYQGTTPPDIAANPHQCPRCLEIRNYAKKLGGMPDEVRDRSLKLGIAEQLAEILGTCQLHFKDGTLIPYTAIPKGEVDKIRGARASLAAQLSNAQTATGNLRRTISFEEGKQQAQAEVQAETKAGESEALAQAAKDKTARAGEIHEEIAQLLLIADVLAPSGVRKTALERTIKAVSEGLNEITTELLGLGTVKLDQDINLTLDGRPYVALSESEQWMVKTAMQLEIARYDESSMVLIDRLDVLQKHYRERMVGTLVACGIPAVIFMSASSPDDVPDLGDPEINFGATYWLEAGEFTPIAEVKGLKEEAA